MNTWKAILCMGGLIATTATPAAIAVTFTETFDTAATAASHGWATFNNNP